MARSASSRSSAWRTVGAASRRASESVVGRRQKRRPAASASCCSISATRRLPAGQRRVLAPPARRAVRDRPRRASGRACASAVRAGPADPRPAGAAPGDASMLSAKSRSVNARSSSCALMPSRASRYGANRGSIAASSPTRFQTRPRLASTASSRLVELRVALAAQPLNACRRCAAPDASAASSRPRPAAGAPSATRPAGTRPARAGRRARGRPCAGDRAARAAPRTALERRRDAILPRRQARPGVEQRQVLLGIEQLLMLVLPVELDEPVRQVLAAPPRWPARRR